MTGSIRERYDELGDQFACAKAIVRLAHSVRSVRINNIMSLEADRF